jgi:hypothetical protein
MNEGTRTRTASVGSSRGLKEYPAKVINDFGMTGDGWVGIGVDLRSAALRQDAEMEAEQQQYEQQQRQADA